MKTDISFFLACWTLWILALGSSQAASEMRQWTDTSGNRLVAALHDVDGEEVILTRDGQTRRVLISNLSPADRNYVSNWVNFQKAAEQAGIPLVEPDPVPTVAATGSGAAPTPFQSSSSGREGTVQESPFKSLVDSTPTKGAASDLTLPPALKESPLAVAVARNGETALANKPLWFVIVFGFAGMFLLFGTLGFLTSAFEESTLWGLGSLLVPVVGIVFLVKHWQMARTGFFVSVLGCLFVASGLLVLLWQNFALAPGGAGG